jgi:hypothetical protein
MLHTLIMNAPIKRNAAAFKRRFEATDRNVRDAGMRSAWRMGFNICVSGQQQRHTSKNTSHELGRPNHTP